jgi:hypothetical protein
LFVKQTNKVHIIFGYNSGTKRYYGTDFDLSKKNKNIEPIELVKNYGVEGAQIIFIDQEGAEQEWIKKGSLCLPIKPLAKDHLPPHIFDFLDHSYWVTARQSNSHASLIESK